MSAPAATNSLTARPPPGYSEEFRQHPKTPVNELTNPLCEKCSKHFKFGDLIECSATFHKHDITNLPRNQMSYVALRKLATEILDPVVDEFGEIKITYGFASPQLQKLIQGGTAPRLDQHAAYEVNSRGNYVCNRRGAAVDLQTTKVDSLTVAKFIASELSFDRLYFYGADRPIHVSHGPQHTRQITTMTWNDRIHRRMPRSISMQKFLDL